MRETLERLSKGELIELILRLQEQVAALEAEVARLRKDSSNSHKPPSSDIVKPPAQATPGPKRQIGGQPGHPKHARAPFAPDKIDDIREYVLERCPRCDGNLQAARGQVRVMQQVELVEQPIRITEHRAYTSWCPHCRKFHAAALPVEVAKCGLVGPRLTALVGYLKGGCHASYSAIQALLGDVMQLSLSSGQLAKLVGKTSAALAGSYLELRYLLPAQERLNVDETGHKDRGDGYWTWCFRAPRFTLFRIDPSRGSKVLSAVLGKTFAGVLGADYFSAYRKYMGDGNVLVQFCLAHLIRDVKFLTTLDAATKRYGQRLLHRLRRLFHVIHRRQQMTHSRFQHALESARDRLLATAILPPKTPNACNLARRFQKHANAYFRFITTPAVEPTNNLAEQALRFVVIDRRITQGTRGAAGRTWSERIWTVIATCAQHRHSAFHFLHQSLLAHLAGQTTPSLLFNSS